jgi:hypothetical protein
MRLESDDNSTRLVDVVVPDLLAGVGAGVLVAIAEVAGVVAGDGGHEDERRGDPEGPVPARTLVLSGGDTTRCITVGMKNMDESIEATAVPGYWPRQAGLQQVLTQCLTCIRAAGSHLTAGDRQTSETWTSGAS